MDTVTAGVAGVGALGGLAAISRPAEVLIQRVSDALGVLYEPTRIIRAAHAEVESEKIRAAGRLELTEMERRGLIRLVKEQGKMQENIEAITARAVESLPPEAHPENLDDDWIRYFFDKGKLVSEPEMQGLWAKLLAGQTGSAGGAFSRNTLNTVSIMDSRDAALFTSLCAFCWTVADTHKSLVVFRLGDDIYAKSGIAFSGINHLSSLGLIHFSGTGYSIRKEASDRLSYFGKRVNLEKITSGGFDLFSGGIPSGEVMFSSAGLELSRLCNPRHVDGFMEYTIARWLECKWSASVLSTG